MVRNTGLSSQGLKGTTVRPQVEELETRLVPALTANFSNGYLFLSGSDGNDVVIVRQSYGRITVDGFSGFLYVSSVRGVRVDTYGGNDWIDTRSLTVPTWQYGGTGNDTLVGGLGNDYLDGGPNRDAMYGTYGRDIVFCSQGGETVSGAEVVRITVDQNYNQVQKTECGPVAVARLLRAYGYSITPRQVYNAAIDSIDSWFIDRLGLGVKPGSLQSAMRRLVGGGSYENQTTMARVINLLSSGRPVVALVRRGSQLHYITLTGVDRDARYIYFTDTNGDRRYYSSYQGFWNDWEWSFGLGDLGLRLVGVRSRTILY